MSTPDRLTQDELSAVLRRAAELDVTTTSATIDPGITVAAVEAAAAEVGLAPEAVRQAVAELRAGVLAHEPEDLVGDDVIVVARTVPQGVDEALTAADAFLGRKVLERVRDRGTARTYRRRDDVLAKLAKGLDFSGGAKKLKAVQEVHVSAVAVTDGTLLRFVIRLNTALAKAPTIAGTAAGVGGALLGGAAAIATTDVALFGLAGLPVGAGAGVVSYRVSRAVLWRERKRVTEVVEGFLDDLELGRRPELGPVERFKRMAPRFRGPWA